MPECFFAHLGGCEGRLVKAHLIPKQRIRREYPQGAAFVVEFVSAGSDSALGFSDGRWRPFDPRIAYAFIGSPGDGSLRSLQDIVWDSRVWTWMCGGPTGIGGHHGAFDAKQIEIARDELPEGIEDFAREYGLAWSLEADYGLPDNFGVEDAV